MYGLRFFFTESGTSCAFLFFKQKTAYEMRISDWSSDVGSSDLVSHGNYFVPTVFSLRFRLLHLPPEAGPSARSRETRMLRTVATLSVFGLLALVFGSSAERRVGTECFSTCSYRGSPYL